MVENCEFSQISWTMMHKMIIIGCYGAVVLNLTVCKKKYVEKQSRQQVNMIAGLTNEILHCF